MVRLRENGNYNSLVCWATVFFGWPFGFLVVLLFCVHFMCVVVLLYVLVVIWSLFLVIMHLYWIVFCLFWSFGVLFLVVFLSVFIHLVILVVLHLLGNFSLVCAFKVSSIHFKNRNMNIQFV